MNSIKPNLNFTLSKLPIEASVLSLERFVAEVRSFLRKFRTGFETHFDNYLTEVEKRTLPLAPITTFRKADNTFIRLMASLKKFEAALREDLFETKAVARDLQSVHNERLKLAAKRNNKNAAQLIAKFNSTSKVFKQLAQDYRDSITNFFQLQRSLEEMIIIYTSLSGKSFKIFMRNDYEEFLELLGLEEAEGFAIKVNRAAESVKKFNDKLVQEFKKNLDLLDESKLLEVIKPELLDLEAPGLRPRTGTGSRPGPSPGSTFEPKPRPSPASTFEPSHQPGPSSSSQPTENPSDETRRRENRKRRPVDPNTDEVTIIQKKKAKFELNTDDLILSITPETLLASGIVEENIPIEQVNVLLDKGKELLKNWNNLWLDGFKKLIFYEDFIAIASDFMLPNLLTKENVDLELKKVNDNLLINNGKLFNDGKAHLISEILEINSLEKREAKNELLKNWLAWTKMIHLYMYFEISTNISEMNIASVNDPAEVNQCILNLTEQSIVCYLYEQSLEIVENTVRDSYDEVEKLRQALMDVYKRGVIQKIKLFKVKLKLLVNPDSNLERVSDEESVKLEKISKLFDDLANESRNIFDL